LQDESLPGRKFVYSIRDVNQKKNRKPVLAVTMGDPAGIGAEVAVKAWTSTDMSESSRLFIIGSAACLSLAMDQTGCIAPLQVIAGPEELPVDIGSIAVMEPLAFEVDNLVQGEVSATCGEAAVRYFETAVELCLDGRVDGVVTCPINKEAVHAAGYTSDIGHQEILTRMTHADSTATMLMTTGLKVAHLSTHKSLAEAVAYVSRPVIVDKLRLTVRSLEAWGIKSPRVAVAALNPHGGEGGMLGREELDEIAPAVEDCRQEGMAVSGPWPADSVFYRAIGGEFDAVLALYHDQGHIAVKVKDFKQSVTATMGIPFIRTSVDHGTAFDIAGRNLADADGLTRALETAIMMLNHELT